MIKTLLFFCLLSTVPGLAPAQTKPEKGPAAKAPLTFSIRLDKDPCAGEKIILRGELKNISGKTVTFNRNSLWKFSFDRALDQFSSSTFLKIPKMRSFHGHDFDDSIQPADYVELRPGEVYRDESTIDPGSDAFFRLAGRYSTQSGYSQPYRLTKRRGNLLFGNVISNELFFEIRKCTPPPTNEVPSPRSIDCGVRNADCRLQRPKRQSPKGLYI